MHAQEIFRGWRISGSPSLGQPASLQLEAEEGDDQNASLPVADYFLSFAYCSVLPQVV